ncbi:MAG: peptidyl-tRNA hydrolase Pth2 [Candidatus Micrarchaeaceae archaeon]
MQASEHCKNKNPWPKQALKEPFACIYYTVELKQAIVVRSDLKMGKGKLVAQASHASLMGYFEAAKRDKKVAKEWLNTGEKKIVLKVSSKEELVSLNSLCSKAHVPCALVIDSGLTQLEPGTPTALGIGPWKSEEIDKITGTLKLL